MLGSEGMVRLRRRNEPDNKTDTARHDFLSPAQTDEAGLLTQRLTRAQHIPGYKTDWSDRTPPLVQSVGLAARAWSGTADSLLFLTNRLFPDCGSR